MDKSRKYKIINVGNYIVIPCQFCGRLSDIHYYTDHFDLGTKDSISMCSGCEEEYLTMLYGDNLHERKGFIFDPFLDVIS